MKKIIFYSIMFLFAFQAEAQVGVLTLKKRENPYYGQWYTTRGQKDHMYLIEKENLVNVALSNLLSPYNQTVSDGELDKDGDLYWEIDNRNGFMAIIYRIELDDEDVLLMIKTVEVEEEEDEVSLWHQKVFR